MAMAMAMAMRVVIWTAAAILGLPIVEARQPIRFDALIVNATLLSQSGELLHAAIGIVDGVVGTIDDAAALYQFADERTHVQDIQGQLLLPGLVDAHVHLITGGFNLNTLDMRGIRSKSEFRERVASAVDKLSEDRQQQLESPAGAWLIGSNWDHSEWGGEVPSKEWVDDIAKDFPIWLTRLDFHCGLASSKALELAGITADTVVESGVFEKDDRGELTGILKDAAMFSVTGAIVRSMSEGGGSRLRFKALENAIRYAHSKGVTQVTDMGDFVSGPRQIVKDMQQVFLPIDAKQSLPLSVDAFVPLQHWDVLAPGHDDSLAEYARWTSPARFHSRFRIAGVKGFTDGSLGSKTAWFQQPYHGMGAEDLGLDILSLSSQEGARIFQENITAASNLGAVVALHAIGDQAVAAAAAALAALPSVSIFGQAFQHRIEHVQHLPLSWLDPQSSRGRDSRQTPPPLANLVASLQPMHAYADAAIIEAALGAERVHAAYAYRAIADELGARIILGSDWPVVEMNQIDAVAGARLKPQTLGQAQALAWDKALWAAFGGRAAGFALEPGMVADLCIVDRGLIGSLQAGEQPEGSGVLATIVGGKCVYGCASGGIGAELEHWEWEREWKENGWV